MINDNITAYSTAVGPSSAFTNRTMALVKCFTDFHEALGLCGGAYEPLIAPFSATFSNVLLALLPNVVIAPMQTTMMSASMTAYSTAVGPSSFLRNLTSSRDT